MNDDQFADTFPAAPNAAICHQQGGRYHGLKFTHEPNTQDAPVSIKGDDAGDMTFYGLFCGFKNGGDLARFAMNRMVYELFLTEQPIKKNSSPETICEALREKFLSVDRRCFEEVDDQLLKLFVCRETEPRDENRISELESKVRAGCTALVVLRIHDDLYILNCGTSQALILTDSQTDNPTIVRLLEAHDNENKVESDRLQGLNIDPTCVSAPTRALGDFFRKKEKYDEDQAFTNAKGAPVIADPDIVHVKLEPGWKHLLLVSGGTIQNIKDCDADDILTEIQEQFTAQFTVISNATTLAFNVARKHRDTYDRHVKNNPQISTSNHCEEMSVIYVKLQEGLPIIKTIDSQNSTINSTIGSIYQEPETFEPYVDLDPARIPKTDKFRVNI